MPQQFTGKQYLKIDIANHFGLDKALWEERLAWFDENEHQLESLLNQAETPALYFAAVQAYRTAQAGLPSGFPISLDATASGMQILACLTGDRRAAEICNVVNTGKRQDAYTAVWLTMQDAAGEQIQITRQQAKDAVMPSFYGSKKAPEDVFGKGSTLLMMFYRTMETLAPGAWELNQAFLRIWDDTVTRHDWVLPDNFHVQVKVMGPVKEEVSFLGTSHTLYREVNRPVKEGRSLGANSIHSIDGMVVREMARRCNYNPLRVECVRAALDGIEDPVPEYPSTPEERAVERMRNQDTEMVLTLWGHYLSCGYLSARIIDHLHSDNVHLVDGAVVRELLDSLPAKPFEVISVHDCFRCLPNYGNDLRRQYNLQLQLIAKSEMLSWMLSQILNREVKVGKLDPELWRDIGEAEYALS